MQGIVADVAELLPNEVLTGAQVPPGRSLVRPFTWFQWFATALLLTAIVLGAAAAPQYQVNLPAITAPLFIEPPAVAPPEEPVLGHYLDDVTQFEPRDDLVLGYVLLAVMGVVLAAALWVLIRHFVKKRKPDQLSDLDLIPDEPREVALDAAQFSTEDIEDTVALARARMAAARTPSDAVVAAWLAFEEAAATRGWVREPHQTTTEFTAMLLANSPAPPEPVATLRGQYQRVRFGGHFPSDDDVAITSAALGDIAQHLNAIPKQATEPKAEPKFATLPPLVNAAPATTKVKAGVSRNKWGED